MLPPVNAVQGGFVHGRPWFYLQTPADQEASNNLMSLPPCPGGINVDVWY